MRMTSLALALLVSTLAPAAAIAQDAADNGAAVLPGAQSALPLKGGPGFVCTATNERRTAQCSVSCPSRESLDCEDAEGGGAPTCQCAKQ